MTAARAAATRGKSARDSSSPTTANKRVFFLYNFFWIVSIQCSKLWKKFAAKRVLRLRACPSHNTIAAKLARLLFAFSSFGCCLSSLFFFAFSCWFHYRLCLLDVFRRLRFALQKLSPPMSPVLTNARAVQHTYRLHKPPLLGRQMSVGVTANL